MKNNLFSEGISHLRCTRLGNISPGQDGAIHNGYLFRLDHNGYCTVHKPQTLEVVATFVLDKADRIVPHANSVCFSNAYYENGDEFPIFYANLYNNYASEENRLEGMCCAYRLTRDDGHFSSQLVQILQVDFIKNSAYWCSENVTDIRPYGNFVIDAADGTLYVYVMRDEAHQTRIFRFALPKVTDGTVDEKWGVPVAHLTPADIQLQFDSEYSHYLQGGTCYNGILYSVEGFSHTSAIRIFDTKKQKQIFTDCFANHGMLEEPELIDVYDGTVYYSDAHGNFYRLQFEK